MKIDNLTEEPLVFGSGKKSVDPKLGMTLYGPSSLEDGAERQIIAGIIGTHGSISQFALMLEKLKHRMNVSGNPEPWKRDFPGIGIKSRLHFDILVGKDMMEFIQPEEEKKVLSELSRKQKILKMRELYDEKFENLLSTVHPAPDIIFLPLSKIFIEQTKDPRFGTDKIRYELRTLQDNKNRTEIPMFDFHHSLKVIGFKHKVKTQLVMPYTYEMTEAGHQDLATSFWNFSVATFYKATGTPWKLANLDEDTCYVGISFYQDQDLGSTTMRTSMAHVYLKTGESQIIRGKGFNWDYKKSKAPYLDSESAKNILSDVIELFKNQKLRKPTRVVVHKSTEFQDEEMEGFSSAAEGVEVLDLIHIYRRSNVRFFYEKNIYPPLRGTLLTGSGSPAFLYTTGFIQALGTYPGTTVPWPLEYAWKKMDSNVSLVAKDIMALTRLDWNNSDFSRSQPVTISVSHKVGEILAESEAKGVKAPTSYSYYM